MRRSNYIKDLDTSRVNEGDGRLSLLFIFFITASIALSGKLFFIQLTDGGTYTTRGAGQYLVYEEYSPLRGDVYMIERGNSEKIPVAENKSFANLFAVPNEVDSPYFIASELSKRFDLDEETLVTRLIKKGDPYEPIKDKLSDEEKKEIEGLLELEEFNGMYLEEETYRHYPYAFSMSQITGFVGYGNQGLEGRYGIEGYFENELGGKKSYASNEGDGLSSFLSKLGKNDQTIDTGNDVVLTIDQVMQFKVCDALAKGVERYGAESGTVVLLEAETSKVRAMCSSPNFDANNYYDTENIHVFNNPAVFEPYEPGSVFKPITIASAINEKKITPSTTYEDEGSLTIGEHTVSNINKKAYGEVDMVTVLTESLNLGAVFAVGELGKEKFADYVRLFGFGKKTEIELAGERAGTIESLDKRGDIYSITASYGQGFTTTPIQLATAYAAIARGGMYIPPTIVEKIIDEKGVEHVMEAKETHVVLESRAATLVKSMMVSVIEEGQANLAGVEGYRVGGKTGTAQIANPDGPGYSNKTNHTFIGFGPIEKPEFVLLVKLKNPTSYQYSSGTAAPLFGEIAKFVLQYYNIPPTTKE